MTGARRRLPDPADLSDADLAAQLVCVPLRGHAGDAEEREGFLAGLERCGWGGVIVFGGDLEAVADLLAEARVRVPIPPLATGDFERGIGQQFPAAGTAFPPLMALGAAGDTSLARSAGEAIGRELRAAGFHVDFWPVADLANEPSNPIVSSRAAAGDPDVAARIVEAVVEGLQAAGIAATLKHFPGHGRTTVDSHETLPVVEADRARILAEAEPFRSGIAAEAKVAMTAHVAYPLLEPDGARDRPATFSRAIVTDLLRGELGFDGLVCTDALMMGAVAGESPGEAAVRALEAGVDWLLYPDDPAAVREGVVAALGEGSLERALVEASVARLFALKAWAGCGKAPPSSPAATSSPLAETVAAEALTARPPDPPAGEEWPDRARWIVVLDGGIEPEEIVLMEELEAGAADRLVVVDAAGDPGIPSPRVEEVRAACAGTVVACAVFNPVRAWKGRAGLSDPARGIVDAACRPAEEAVLILFSDPRIVSEVHAPPRVVWAYGEDAASQRAVVAFLRGERPARGTLPVRVAD
ncbi:MAG: glycoside hydrolase family 3 N-terminal domain-containing protein [Gemmatimonadota bacterium]|nr:glycoside hydrolase family 3 N-terminal domain-containing protein [Gemmatimonadota bacterium]